MAGLFDTAVPTPMKVDKVLFLVRHGQTEWNAERRMQGQENSPLTPNGHRQARASGKFLKQAGVDTLYASPLGRVRETVAEIRKELDLDPTFDARLMEYSVGEWSGYLHADLSEKWPEAFTAWEADRYNARPPGGENYPDMIKRVAPLLGEILSGPGKNIGIISHGMIGRGIVTYLLGLKPARAIRIRQRHDIVIRVRPTESGWHSDYFDGTRGPRSGLPLAGH